MNLTQSEIAEVLGVSRQFVHQVLSKGKASERTVLAMKAVAESRTGKNADAVLALKIVNRKSKPQKEYKPRKPSRAKLLSIKEMAKALSIHITVLYHTIKSGEDYEPRLSTLKGFAKDKTGVWAERVHAMTPRKESYPFHHAVETPKRLKIGIYSWVRSLSNYCGITSTPVYYWVRDGVPDRWRDTVLAWIAENNITEPEILKALGLKDL